MKANLINGVLSAALGASLAAAQGTLPPPNAPTHNPGFADEVPNKELSGHTPQTNSTLQKDADGNMGTDYFGWLGLIGLAGLFGLSRGSNPSPRSDNHG